jgi:hypothetical protein
MMEIIPKRQLTRVCAHQLIHPHTESQNFSSVAIGIAFANAVLAVQFYLEQIVILHVCLPDQLFP